MTISTETPSRRAIPSDQDIKLGDAVDDINVVRRLLRAAQMAASSDDVPSDCGLETLLDTIHEKLTAARDKIRAACHLDEDLADV
jgi:hypothetical protein